MITLQVDRAAAMKDPVAASDCLPIAEHGILGDPHYRSAALWTPRGRSSGRCDQGSPSGD